jgi:hypothetical protein
VHKRAAHKRGFQQYLGGVRLQVAALIERGQQSGRITADIRPLALDLTELAAIAAGVEPSTVQPRG